jgi:hypothetical protein
MVVEAKAMPRTKRYEYRVERLPYMEDPEEHFQGLLDRLGELTVDGWRVVSVDLTFHPAYSPGVPPSAPLPVLLEREIEA